MGVDEMGVDEVGVDEMGSRRSGTTPNQLHVYAVYDKSYFYFR